MRLSDLAIAPLFVAAPSPLPMLVENERIVGLCYIQLDESTSALLAQQDALKTQ